VTQVLPTGSSVTADSASPPLQIGHDPAELGIPSVAIATNGTLSCTQGS